MRTETAAARETSPAADAAGPVLEMRDVSITYAGGVPAAIGVDLTIAAGEIVGVIGESGSGKTSLAHSVLGLLPSSARITGERLSLAGTDLLGADRRTLAGLRGPAAAMVFQNPMTAFSPLHTLGRQLADLMWRERASTEEKRTRIVAALKDVGLSDPEARLGCYPFELSGGMLQRAAIAAALLMRPALLIADEPTTALDVTTEAQILHLMRELNAASGVAILMISHHLGVIAELCDRVAVMYAGRIVEEGPVEAIFAAPRHPYTRALFACEPALIAAGAGRMPVIAGEVPRAGRPGCGFAPRCAEAEGRCASLTPPRVVVDTAGGVHAARCLRLDAAGGTA
ncbi:ABC transporter ATP-binding protein [Segnochrobactrum spirostomi]|uniref:ABC transporter ATP-binding protein n=1 Tax=Segnochrobactrum spirostomi TaxID=2608987 RepID=A0A6A7Y4M9_9HYPH|nr:ABC transporter ATP-binding protein [Segnochrobactrum spirostomi]MQT13168.1 ABC transporter ATP-binding protein [Segnochrobactrum spirostomi]